MAYYPYQNYYSNYNQFPQTQVPSQQNNQGSLIWVQGIEAAKSYMVAPNATVLLMDSESQRFYLKSSDGSGMPLPLRVFEYTETPQNGANKAVEEKMVDYSSFATKAELDAFRDEIQGILKNVPKQTYRRRKEDDEDE